MKLTGRGSSLLMLILCVLFFTNCKKQKINDYYYKVENDVLAPEILPSFPVANSNISGVSVIHIVGTVKDDETPTRGGKLLSCTLRVNEVDGGGIVIKTLKNENLPVDGLPGFSYNKSFPAPTTNGHIYEVAIVAKDYANRTASLQYLFYY